MLVVIPKNRGLAARVDEALAIDALRPDERVCRVRGEDVPAVASMLAANGRAVRACTGEDLLEEWLAHGFELDSALRARRIAWSDREAIFGKPALCLITPSGCGLGSGRTRVGICARYARLAERGLTRVERELGCTFQRTYHHGALEALLEHDLADAIVDVVVTGKTIRAHDFRVIDLFFRSDLVMLETA